jgi:hypothetical protein
VLSGVPPPPESYSPHVASSYGGFEPERIRHLELLQAVISRLANEAALIRGWALTVSAAFFGFAARSLSWRIATVGMLPVVVFWGLNAYYLRAERRYRSLYDRVRRHDASVELFSMDASDEKVDSTWDVAWSSTLRTFYGVILVVGAILIIAGIWKN